MFKIKKKSITVVLVMLVVFSLVFAGCVTNTLMESSNEQQPFAKKTTGMQDDPIELLVYSGAGLKVAMEDIKTMYEANHNVTIQYIYSGSAQLISQIEMSGKGDVLIVGSENAYDIAKEDGYTDETSYQVAHHTPCIAVYKGNPKGITCLEDLTQEGITVILGDSKANAIGITAQKIIDKTGFAGINENVVSQTATVNEIVTQISRGQADAGIVTMDQVHSNADIEIVEISNEQNIEQIITAGSLKMSENRHIAQSFIDFILSEQGKEIFEVNGFMRVE